MNVAADLRSPSYPRSTCQVRLFAIFVVVPGSTSAISQSRMYNYASTDLDEVRSFPLYLVYDLPSVSVDMTTGYSLGGTCYLRTRRKQPVPPCMLCIFGLAPPAASHVLSFGQLHVRSVRELQFHWASRFSYSYQTKERSKMLPFPLYLFNLADPCTATSKYIIVPCSSSALCFNWVHWQVQPAIATCLSHALNRLICCYFRDRYRGPSFFRYHRELRIDMSLRYI